jgi:SAM-dependent methyltransferase
VTSYRDSHLGKGADYDRALAHDPLDAYMARRERAIVLALLPQLQQAGVRRALDFACGTGRMTQLLDGAAEACFGVDVSESMVAQARAKCPHTRFFVQDILEQPLPIAPVQLVTAFRFFGNAEDGLRVRALQAIYRSLAPGGYLLLNDHENPWALQQLLRRLMGERPRADLHHWKLRRLLRGAGFSVRRTFGIGLWIYRAKLQRPDVLNSRWTDALELLSGIPVLNRLCPDAVILAQRR